MRSLVALALVGTVLSMTFGSKAANASCVEANLAVLIAGAAVLVWRRRTTMETHGR